MKKRRFFISIAEILLCMVLLFTGCEFSNADDILNDAADDFASGKEVVNYVDLSPDKLLDKMLDDFSGSYFKPSFDPTITDDDDFDDDYDDDSEEPDDGDSSFSREGFVTCDKDFLEVFLEAMVNTSKTFEFRVKGYDFDLSRLNEFYTAIQRKDPINVSCLDAWGGTNNGDEWTVYLTYTLDIDELKTIKKETRKYVDAAVKDIRALGVHSDYEIVDAVNTYLCDNVYYPEEPYAAITHTAYGALKNGCAVCEGYACAAKLMLDELGIKADIEIGPCTNGEWHAWNLVMVDGSWYQLDVTWNDGSGDFSKTGRTLYFLVTDEYMKQSRSWDYSDYPVTPKKPYKA